MIIYILVKLVLLMVQLRRNLKQTDNLLNTTRLPRYQSVYKQEKLFNGNILYEIYTFFVITSLI